MKEANGSPTPPEIAMKTIHALTLLHEVAEMRKKDCHPLGIFGGCTIEQTHGDYRFEIRIRPKD